MVRNLMLTLVMILGLTACTPDQVVRLGNTAEEKTLDYTKAFGCEEMDIGLWLREFGSSPEKARAWAVLCGYSLVNLPGS